MDLPRKSIKYQNRIFLIITVFIWILTFSFFIIQFTREKEYKINLLNNELQILNDQVLYNIENKQPINYNLINHIIGQDSLRVTVLDYDGRVVFDTYKDKINENHKSRKEIQDALAFGSGHTLRRHSNLNAEEYFYSATKGSSFIVRSALPYNTKLTKELEVNPLYICVIILIAISLTIIAFIAAQRVGQSIKYLRDFANEAEEGNISSFDSSVLPNDELGEISSHIVNLYKNLEATTKERDETTKNLLLEEQEKTRIKHQMTSNINHELKTPVHAIQACLETILTNKEILDKDKIIELTENSYHNIKRLYALMGDIATITNMTDAADQIERREVRIKPILDDLVKETSLLPAEKQMRINISVPENVSLMGNQALIEAIFKNIIHNALEYSGGRDIHIDLIEDTPEYYKFKVWDNGIGVAQEHLQRLFERFYRTDDGRSRKLGGTGLGLSIVKNSVLFHGGTISVKSPLNTGLEFTFTLHK